jgi:hypothetical protein
MAALRLCLDRILPPRKDRPVTFTLPPIKSAQDAAATVSAVLQAVCCRRVDASRCWRNLEADRTLWESVRNSRAGRTFGAPGKDDFTMIARNVEARIVKL